MQSEREMHLDVVSSIRLGIGVIATVLLFIAGHDLRAPLGAPDLDRAMGMFCYGFACAVLMAAIPVTYIRDITRGERSASLPTQNPVSSDR